MSEAVVHKEGGEASRERAQVRILVVDDSAAARTLIIAALSTLHATKASGADSAAQALRALRDGDFSLVLCDYEIPDMSGLQLLHIIRARRAAIELPVLMLTSREDADIKLRAFRAGANDYVSKHAPIEELLARVGVQIKLLEAQRRLAEVQQRRREAQEFEAVGHLAEALAHELNTPAQYLSDNLAFLKETFDALLKLVVGMRDEATTLRSERVSELLAQADVDYVVQEVPRCLEESAQGITQVAHIVSTMREFARLGAQDKVPQDINEIVRSAVGVTRGHWHQVADIALELNEALPHVECVAARIKQVILYIIIEAVHALSPRDGLQSQRGWLRFRTFRATDACVVIEVSHNGRPIPAAVIKDVSRPVLAGLPPSEAGQALTHARSVIVSEHGGHLDVESRDGMTLISMRLPSERDRISRVRSGVPHA